MSSSNFEDLSLDLQTEIVARVASTSLADYFNMKKSCKKIRYLAEEGFVYGKVCLEKIPIDAWYSSNGRISLFINQCLENENPEALFRQAMVEYFCWGEIETATEYVNSAAVLDHHGAAYLLGLMLLFHGEEYKYDGIKMLSTVKKSSCFNGSVPTYRKLLIELLRKTKIQNLDVLYYRPSCCDDRVFHGYCDACFCDFELSYIFNALDRC
ncbi:putative F-box protein At1g67623 [Henckelia pumila]|uniref:putative F-box protein At1g67623 n=1 Tax=Henckelia pumila TaxID=405737 RepID=UPI003C6DFE59